MGQGREVSLGADMSESEFVWFVSAGRVDRRYSRTLFEPKVALRDFSRSGLLCCLTLPYLAVRALRAQGLSRWPRARTKRTSTSSKL